MTAVCTTTEEAIALFVKALPLIEEECLAVLGGEQHYQAVVYHCLRMAGLPRTQLGMNVKQWIDDPVTSVFQQRDMRKHLSFRGGFEPIPDLVVFSSEIAGNWQRRNYKQTLQRMLLAAEIKASERASGRLTAREILGDIQKLAAHRDEVRFRGSDMQAVMLVIDSAHAERERMTPEAIEVCFGESGKLGVAMAYIGRASTRYCERLS